MSAAIEDVSSLPGKEVADQEACTIGEIKQIYALDGDGHPTWVSIEATFDEDERRTVLVPIARLKEEDGSLRVPYSKRHLGESPEVQDGEELSEECEKLLRAHYGIDRGDQELRSDNKSYATLVPEEQGASRVVENPDQLETPSSDKRTDETKSRVQDPGSSEIRQVTAEDVVEQGGNVRRAEDDGAQEGGGQEGGDQEGSEQEGGG
jgi:PRC-barrel domain protein